MIGSHLHRPHPARPSPSEGQHGTGSADPIPGSQVELEPDSRRGLLVSLIGRSVLGETEAERRAAAVLLGLLRSRNGIAHVQEDMDRLSDRLAYAVAFEVNKLIRRYDLL